MSVVTPHEASQAWDELCQATPDNRPLAVEHVVDTANQELSREIPLYLEIVDLARTRP